MAESTHYQQLAESVGVPGSDTIAAIFETLANENEASVMVAASPPATLEELSEKTGIQKDEIEKIRLIVADVLDAIENEKSPWQKMFERLGGFYDRKFCGPDWREKEKKFWENKFKQQFPYF